LKAPAFQLYSNDFLVDTLDWSIEEMGIYTRLLFYQWTNGSLPDDEKRLARIAGCGTNKFIANSKKVLSKFVKSSEGFLQNERMELTRQQQSQFIESQREKGKKRAAKRWEGHIATAIPRLQPEDKPKNGSSSSTSSSIKNNKKNIIGIPPKTEDVRGYCSERNNGINAEQFFDYYESRGWMIGKNKMKDWKAAIRTWERNNKDNPSKPIDTEDYVALELAKIKGVKSE
jgi:uncharacterized protein YdaU (DUF1376 family)